jgi:phage/plasmid-associated DNA primase
VAIGVAAFYGVLRRGSFSFENTPEDARHKWMSRSDAVYAFMEWLKSSGALVEYPGRVVQVDDLYTYYTRYCIALDEEPESQAEFTKRLKSLGYVVKVHSRIPRLRGYVLADGKLREVLQKLVEESGEGE